MINENVLKEFPYLEYAETPRGWDFLIVRCAVEIKERLVSMGLYDTYEVIQIKEKYGTLRWYSNYTFEIRDIVRRYEEESANICAFCGCNATHMTGGYILPLCDECDNNEW